MQNGSGIRITLMIPYDDVMGFLKGEQTRAWQTLPNPKFQDKEDWERYFPKGGTQVKIDPDEVEVEKSCGGAFTIRKKRTP